MSILQSHKNSQAAFANESISIILLLLTSAPTSSSSTAASMTSVDLKRRVLWGGSADGSFFTSLILIAVRSSKEFPAAPKVRQIGRINQKNPLFLNPEGVIQTQTKYRPFGAFF